MTSTSGRWSNWPPGGRLVQETLRFSLRLITFEKLWTIYSEGHMISMSRLTCRFLLDSWRIKPWRSSFTIIKSPLDVLNQSQQFLISLLWLQPVTHHNESTCTCLTSWTWWCWGMKAGFDMTSCSLNPSSPWSPERQGGRKGGREDNQHIFNPLKQKNSVGKTVTERWRWLYFTGILFIYFFCNPWHFSHLFARGRELVGVRGQGFEVIGDCLEVGDLTQHRNLLVLRE